MARAGLGGRLDPARWVARGSGLHPFCAEPSLALALGFAFLRLLLLLARVSSLVCVRGLGGFGGTSAVRKKGIKAKEKREDFFIFF